MKNTFGNWTFGSSFIHNMDPRIKFVSYLILLVTIFLWPMYFWIHFIYLLLFFWIFIMSKLRFSELKSIFISILFVSIFLFIFNLLNINQEEKHHETGKTFFNLSLNWEWWIFSLRWKTIFTVIFLTLRIFLVIFLTFIFTATTNTYEIAFAIASFLSPLRLIGFPNLIFAMIISLTFRLVPTLIQEGNTILLAQSSRGLDFKSSSITNKAKISVALIIPLLVSTFNRASEMANALESRGYNPNKKKTLYQQFTIRLIDWFSLFFIFFFLICTILTFVFFGNVFEDVYFFKQFNQFFPIFDH